MRTRINEDFFDDNRIETADYEPDYEPEDNSGSDPVKLGIMFRKFGIPEIISYIKRKLYFLRNFRPFEQLYIQKIVMNTTTGPDCTDYPNEFPKDISGVPVETVQATAMGLNGIIEVSADIYFKANMCFRTPKEIYDMDSVIGDYGSTKDKTPKIQTVWCPKTLNGYTNMFMPEKKIVDGDERYEIYMMGSAGGVLRDYQIILFYYAYINDGNMLDRLKRYIENKGETAKRQWNGLFRII